MDGRVQEPLRRWIVDRYNVEYVDTVTQPGIDKIIQDNQDVKLVLDMAKISIIKHGSRTVVVSGHHDCAGNPVSRDTHVEHIRNSMDVIKSWNLDVNVVGVWVNDQWQVEEVT